MDRSTQWAVVLTAVGIVALSLSAATLPSTVSTDTAVGPGESNASGSGILPTAENVEPATIDFGVPAWIVTVLLVASLVFGAAYFFVEPKMAVIHTAVVLVFVGALLGVLFVIAEIFDMFSGGGDRGDDLLGRSAGSTAGGELDPTSVDPSLVAVAGIVVVVVAIAVVALYGATGDATEEGSETARPAADGGDGNSIEGVGRAAGRAADRIEAQAGVDNEVYRAWREMATLLAAERPETSTPREFAADAAAAGMDPADVDELTRLFEEVRYGDATPTEERERRAVDILRRIEETYAGEEDQWT